MIDLNKKLNIKIESWDHKCADGCCTTWGKDIYVNDVKLDIEDSDPGDRVILEEVLKHLGFKNLKITEIYE